MFTDLLIALFEDLSTPVDDLGADALGNLCNGHHGFVAQAYTLRRKGGKHALLSLECEQIRWGLETLHRELQGRSKKGKVNDQFPPRRSKKGEVKREK